MSSSRRRNTPPLAVDVGCGCPRPLLPPLFSVSSSALSLKQSISVSEKDGTAIKRRKGKTRNGRAEEEGEAVVKESSNPYLDFYESMVEMIVEKEMYGWEDLCQLLRRYLTLNSSCHHRIILGAFSDIWIDVFSCHPLH